LSIWMKLGKTDETRELLGRLKVSELKELARRNNIALQKENSLGEVRSVRSKEDIIDVLVESDFKASDLVELLGVSRLTKEELLHQMNLNQLKRLARESGILLEKTSFFRTKKATKKEDIIDLLKVLTPSKVRDYAEKIKLIKKPAVKRAKKAKAVKEARVKKKTRSAEKAKKKSKPIKKERKKRRAIRTGTSDVSPIRKKPVTRREDREVEVIKAISPRGARSEEIVEEIVREKIIEREIVRRRIGLGTDDSNVLKMLRYARFVGSRRERGYETQLSQMLSTKGYPIEPERSRKDGGFNIVLGENDIAIEVKTVKDVNVLNSLIGKIRRHKDRFRKIFIVFIDELQDPSLMRREAKRIEKIDPEKIKVVIKKPKKK